MHRTAPNCKPITQAAGFPPFPSYEPRLPVITKLSPAALLQLQTLERKVRVGGMCWDAIDDFSSLPVILSLAGMYWLTGRKLGQAVTTSTTSSHQLPVLEWNVEPRPAQGWASSSANINTFMSLPPPPSSSSSSSLYGSLACPYTILIKDGPRLVGNSVKKSGGAIARRSMEKTLILHFLYWKNTNGYSS